MKAYEKAANTFFNELQTGATKSANRFFLY